MITAVLLIEHVMIPRKGFSGKHLFGHIDRLALDRVIRPYRTSVFFISFLIIGPIDEPEHIILQDFGFFQPESDRASVNEGGPVKDRGRVGLTAGAGGNDQAQFIQAAGLQKRPVHDAAAWGV